MDDVNDLNVRCQGPGCRNFVTYSRGWPSLCPGCDARDRALVSSLCERADGQAPVCSEDRILTKPEGVPVTMAELVAGGGR